MESSVEDMTFELKQNDAKEATMKKSEGRDFQEEETKVQSFQNKNEFVLFDGVKEDCIARV